MTHIDPSKTIVHPIGMNLRWIEDVNSDRSEGEGICLESVFRQIDTTLTLARIAETFYGLGAGGNADRFFAKAWEGYYEAVDQVGILSIDQKRRDDIIDILTQVCSLLHSFAL